jgi:hypothetical protein
MAAARVTLVELSVVCARVRSAGPRATVLCLLSALSSAQPVHLPVRDHDQGPFRVSATRFESDLWGNGGCRAVRSRSTGTVGVGCEPARAGGARGRGAGLSSESGRADRKAHGEGVRACLGRTPSCSRAVVLRLGGARCCSPLNDCGASRNRCPRSCCQAASTSSRDREQPSCPMRRMGS